MYISFSTTDAEGQFQPGFALEVRSLTLAGITDKGFQFDIHHLDGEQERLALGGTPYRNNITLGNLERIMDVRMTGERPAVLPISKEEFRTRVGIGRILDKRRGYYV
jgi:hypothetical protein